MNKKIILWIVVGIVLVLVISTNLGLFRSSSINGNVVNNGNSDLDKYRSDDIPVDCRLPQYENSVESWKEHLGHHENTLYCLDYYKEVN
ncbi:MAG: hypothetical protein KKF56_02035 [Nanoarchaeota archaeon]|nr:hypothetical protein [Nanoarchaeota archaeon]